MKRRSQRTYKKRNQRKNRKTRKQRQRQRKQRGGSVLNAPNGSVVNVRLEKGDDYQPFVTLYKEDAEREDL